MTLAGASGINQDAMMTMVLDGHLELDLLGVVPSKELETSEEFAIVPTKLCGHAGLHQSPCNSKSQKAVMSG